MHFSFLLYCEINVQFKKKCKEKGKEIILNYWKDLMSSTQRKVTRTCWCYALIKCIILQMNVFSHVTTTNGNIHALLKILKSLFSTQLNALMHATLYFTSNKSGVHKLSLKCINFFSDCHSMCVLMYLKNSRLWAWYLSSNWNEIQDIVEVGRERWGKNLCAKPRRMFMRIFLERWDSLLSIICCIILS